MKKSKVVLAFESFRDLKPVLTKVGTHQDMMKIISLPLQKPVINTPFKPTGLKYI